MSEFKERVITIIQSIPYGHVVNYGQVAAYIGAPRAARQVGRILRTVDTELPWWRVINTAGRITIKGSFYNDRVLQKKLLEAEGIVVANDFTLDINKYRYVPSDKEFKQLNLDDKYIKTVREKYFRT